MPDYEVTSFSAGELTPKGNGRIDTQSYINGCRTLLNGIVLPQGGITRRPGTERMAALPSNPVFIDFEGKDGIGYVIILSNHLLNVYYLGVKLTGFGVSGDISTDWTDAMTPYVSVTVDGNKMYMFHRDAVGQVLTYTPGSPPSFALATWTGAIGTNAAANWDAQSLTTADNRPGVCTMYEGRLIVASSNNYPDYIWGSRVKSNEEFEEETTLVATDAFEVKIGSGKGPKINWMRGARGIFTGTSKGVFSVSDENNLLSPVTLITARMNSSYPSGALPGVFLGGELFYMQAGKRKVRLAAYDINSDIYLTPDVTTIAEHITLGLIKKIAVQILPETLVWCVLEDGTMISYSFSKENQVSAWSRHSTDGDVVDISIVTEGTTEVIYLAVDRGGTVYMEKMYPVEFTDNNYMYLDSSKEVVFGTKTAFTTIVWGSTSIVLTKTSHGLSGGEYIQITGTGNTYLDSVIFQVGLIDANSFELLDEVTGQMAVLDDFGTISSGYYQLASNEITGLSDYEGEELYVVSGPVPIGPYTVSSGQITVTHRRVKFRVGYNYYTDISPMNIAVGKHKKKRIISLAIELLNSLGGKSGQTENMLDSFESFYDKSIKMDNPQDLISGTVRVPHRGGFAYEGKILIRQDLPLPLTVLSMTVEVEVEK